MSTSPYSAFFSSGLLAPRTAYPAHDYDDNAAPSSPIMSDAEVELERNTTPVPPEASATSGLLQPPSMTTSTAQLPTTPRLRKRRSSLSLAASPVSAFKNFSARLTMPGRPRSGSVNSIAASGTSTAVASEETSMLGRMGIARTRSGSVGVALRLVSPAFMLIHI